MNDFLLKLIPTGKQNARSCKELARLTGLSIKGVKAHISKLRQGGQIICSSLDNSKGGYYLPETLEELKEYTTIERARIRTAAAALRPAVKELQKYRVEKSEE